MGVGESQPRVPGRQSRAGTTEGDIVEEAAAACPVADIDNSSPRAYVVGRECVLRYDNESGKGDHRYVGGTETPYGFVSVDQLLDDFLADVAAWKGG